MSALRTLALMAACVAPLAQAAAPADPAEFPACLAGLKAAAQAKGVSSATYERLTASLAPDLKVLELLDFQP